MIDAKSLADGIDRFTDIVGRNPEGRIVATKLGEVLDYHNFVLRNYFKVAPVDFQQTLDEEGATDKALTKLAESINVEAEEPAGDEPEKKPANISVLPGLFGLT